MQEFEEALLTLREAGRYRQLRRMESASAPRVQVESRELVMCASNNYLGFANDERVIQAACAALQTYGTGASGSRLITGNSTLHEQLEATIARFKQTESAILFNTGYMANVAALTTLFGDGDVIFSDELNHASIIDGCRMSKAQVVIYRHSDMADLQGKMEEFHHAKKKLIVTDGVFSMDGDIAPLPQIVELAQREQAFVMVDDAHATGVLGAHGGGTVDYFQLDARYVQIQVGTLSKAISSEGGFIAGDQVLIDYLRNKARPFIFSTALSPGVVAAALTAIELIGAEADRRNRLHRLSIQLRSALAARGFQVQQGETPIIPVVIGEERRALAFAKRLETLGVFAPAIRPPSVPVGSSRIRLTLMATHSDRDLELILHAFETAGKEVGVIS
ncbi:8-amino-7-oxononanoate synthase [Sulfoacidibacillus thermotolerans]|uniref:8-amino-7-ketopelargonate synthase n=1 Tax=Sulfoacidibacillus thermotolerans TaxID=1765684 RepID=A0A2U3DCL5_SULT2|nr:8-amino-7-oxononanoate synthase [Sulfoacidibacillus thermotolerans]